MTATRPSIVVVGSINEDVVFMVPRAPQPGETLAADGMMRTAGGKGANQAVAAARAGVAVAMIGRVGDDPAGQRMIASLRDAGVATELVAVLAGCATGCAYITVTPDGENTIVVERGANGRLGPKDIEDHRDTIAGSEVLLAQLEVPLASVAAAVQLAVAAGSRPVLTAAPAQTLPEELLRGVDPLLVNEHEAPVLLRDRNEDRAAADVAMQLLELGPRSVVVTLGARGAVVAQPEGVIEVPAPPVERVLDTTGAGDAFAGALAAALARGASLHDAVRRGISAAAELVGRPGAR